MQWKTFLQVLFQFLFSYLIIAPKLPVNKDKDYLKKKAYGKTPKYMEKIKKEIEDEYQLVKEMQVEEDNEREK